MGLPVEDALRGGFKFVTDELSSEENAELMAAMGAKCAAEEQNDLPVGAMKGSLAVSGVDMGESALNPALAVDCPVPPLTIGTRPVSSEAAFTVAVLETAENAPL